MKGKLKLKNIEFKKSETDYRCIIESDTKIFSFLISLDCIEEYIFSVSKSQVQQMIDNNVSFSPLITGYSVDDAGAEYLYLALAGNGMANMIELCEFVLKENQYYSPSIAVVHKTNKETSNEFKFS